MERLLRGRVAAEPVEALEQRTSTGPRRALGHDRPADRAAAVRDPAQRLLNARPAKDVQARRVHRIRQQREANAALEVAVVFRRLLDLWGHEARSSRPRVYPSRAWRARRRLARQAVVYAAACVPRHRGGVASMAWRSRDMIYALAAACEASA